MNRALNTFLLIDKPAGFTSFDVCAKLRKPLGVKRIGHTGTLDPFATGLLIVAVGKCTKLIPLLEKDKKIYRTKIVLGKTSETLDPESEIVDTLSKFPLVGGEFQAPSRVEVETLLKEKFMGPIEQIPPQYSALKINGQRAYDLARKGEVVEMKPRQTEVLDIQIVDYKFPELTLDLTVAAGFYVRSLARDVGTALAGGGLCAELRRTGVGELNLAGGLPVVTDLEAVDESYFVDPQTVLPHLPQFAVDPNRLPDLQAGRAIMIDTKQTNGVQGLMVCEGQTVGLGEIKEGNLQPRVVF